MTTKLLAVWSLLSILATTSTSEVLHTLASPNEELDGRFGYSVSGAGDVNGDGYDDVVVGARNESPGSSPFEAGRAYVFDGQTGAVIHTMVSPNEEEVGNFGCSVSSVGDVNDDGCDDVVVGACTEDPGYSPDLAGRAYVFDGLTGNLLHTLASPRQEQSGLFRTAVSGAGDVNGDGRGDVVVGAEGEDHGVSPENAGRAYVFDGLTGTLLYGLVSQNEELYGRFGQSVSGSGDVNGDGYDGASGEDPGTSPTDAGRAYVFSWIRLSPSLSDSALALQWSTWPTALEYWIYGADNLPFFDPGFAPSYQFKLDEVAPPTVVWSSPNGVGDPDHNWTYTVIAVDDSENELARSNYCGEQDFEGNIP